MFGIERFFDRAKGVAVAAGAASLLAIGGVVTLAISAAMTLEMWMPATGRLRRDGGGLPRRRGDRDVGRRPAEEAGEARASPRKSIRPRRCSRMLDLPVEVAKQIIKERPVAATVVVAGLGLLIARKPQIALNMVDKLLERFGGIG